ncbi:MAG TPA: DUF3678 domain-containing protein [Candidatus Aminicenantes bacterium]|nr:DUF3678 domain-containing protein [Candidatus Aminicenantes bacterium]
MLLQLASLKSSTSSSVMASRKLGWR